MTNSTNCSPKSTPASNPMTIYLVTFFTITSMALCIIIACI